MRRYEMVQIGCIFRISCLQIAPFYLSVFFLFFFFVAENLKNFIIGCAFVKMLILLFFSRLGLSIYA